MSELFETIELWGVEAQGAMLHINKYPSNSEIGPVAIVDVETDEADNFVGIGFTYDGLEIFYHTSITEELKKLLCSAQLIGHNVKSDLKWLIGWGVEVSSDQLFYDTALASYVQNTTKKSHGLKYLASEILDLDWPKYKEVVGTGKKKLTLDKQETELVANYCGMDCLATYRLYRHFTKTMSDKEDAYLKEIEIPAAKILMDMELAGMALDLDCLNKLDAEFTSKVEAIEEKVQDIWKEKIGDEKLNINSKRQLGKLLESFGADLPKTFKGNKKVDKKVLENLDHLEVARLLLEYSKLSKIKSTYIKGLLGKQKHSKIHCNFNQISNDSGITTGRLSSSGPNLQNIPTTTDEGKLVREVFIAEEGNFLLDLDFSQIEPRLVAHITEDDTFVKAYRDGRDIYEELVEGTGRKRKDGKTFMLALLYGAQPKKLASVFKCDEMMAEDIIRKIMSKLPKVRAWIERVKHKARISGEVYTLYGRRIPLPGINSEDRYERLHWERVAVNSIIQGSAAEVMKKSLIALRKGGYLPILTVHDSFMVEVPEELVEDVKADIKNILENVVKLNVPLKVSTGVGKNWKECKDNEEKD